MKKMRFEDRGGDETLEEEKIRFEKRRGVETRRETRNKVKGEETK